MGLHIFYFMSRKSIEYINKKIIYSFCQKAVIQHVLSVYLDFFLLNLLKLFLIEKIDQNFLTWLFIQIKYTNTKSKLKNWFIKKKLKIHKILQRNTLNSSNNNTENIIIFHSRSHKLYLINYECEVNYIVCELYFFFAEVTSNMAPQTNQKSVIELNMDNSNDVHLPCNVQGNPLPIIT